MASPSPIDLHAHSTASDGTLSPAALVRRATAQGVKVLALTDHDTVSGLDEAQREAAVAGVTLVPGVEVSTQWQGRDLHIVGLRVGPSDRHLLDGLAWNQGQRRRRARTIAERLERAGIPGAMDVVEGAGDSIPTRSHFARFLLDGGWVSGFQQAFDRYLRRGKPGWACVDWMQMDTAVRLIRGAGGVAVLAHPTVYGYTGAWMRRILDAFSAAGGEGVEVVSGSTDSQGVQKATGFALRHGLRGSVGSDFHGPENPWVELGRLRQMPGTVKPVWSDWPAEFQPPAMEAINRHDAT
ncbi:MAG: PHP domain-containing protein [Ectothiorhodospiraceae bacterium]|nr:PHP domain-containing protein [Ectothiorhodospiraceae bacterium]